MQVFEYVIVKKSVVAGNGEGESLSLLDGRVHLCLAETPEEVLKHAAEDVLAKQKFNDGETISISLRPFQRDSRLVQATGEAIVGGFGGHHAGL